MPNFSTSFEITKNGKSSLSSDAQFFFTLCSANTDVDPVSVEVAADEVIGNETAKERTLIESKLGGTRNNRVFAFFGIEVPRRAAEARLAGAEGKKKAKGEPSGVTEGKCKTKGGSSTGALEKRKQSGKGSGAHLKKRSRLIDTVLAQSPLCGKGNSEEKVESSGNSATVERTPLQSRAEG